MGRLGLVIDEICAGDSPAIDHWWVVRTLTSFLLSFIMQCKSKAYLYYYLVVLPLFCYKFQQQSVLKNGSVYLTKYWISFLVFNMHKMFTSIYHPFWELQWYHWPHNHQKIKCICLKKHQHLFKKPKSYFKKVVSQDHKYLQAQKMFT